MGLMILYVFLHSLLLLFSVALHHVSSVTPSITVKWDISSEGVHTRNIKRFSSSQESEVYIHHLISFDGEMTNACYSVDLNSILWLHWSFTSLNLFFWFYVFLFTVSHNPSWVFFNVHPFFVYFILINDS